MTDPFAVPLRAVPTVSQETSGGFSELEDELDAILWRSNPATFEFIAISRGIERWLGFRVERWMQRGFWLSRVHPDDRERVERVCHEAIACRRDHVIEYRMVAECGAERWLRDHVRFVRAADGREFAQGVLVDIERQKEAEAGLRQQHDFAARLLDTVEAAVLVLDADGRIRRPNVAAERLLNRTRADLQGHAFAEAVVAASDRAAAEDLVRRVRTSSGRASAELRARGAKGLGEVVLWTLTPLTDEDEPGMLATGLDLTERLEREEQLRRIEDDMRQAQKMEALGRLAGSVAHDFNNTVTAILGFTHALARVVAEQPEAMALVDGVREAANHSAQLASRLRELGRRRPESLGVLDLGLEISRMRPVLERAAGHAIRVELALGATGARVLADGCELSQVLLNLVLNSRDAMPRGGSIVVATRFLPAEGVTRGVELSVRDSGQGMDAVTLARAFEPFFTTKGAAGSGLGLSTVYTAVTRWGGRLAIESEIGSGTTLSIRLPLAGRSRVQRAHMQQPVPESPRARVLVVEDEPAVRRLMVEALQRDGHEVFAAAHGREAVAVLAARGHACDLVVTDVVMPGMGGLELAARLERERPGLPVLFVSGYSVCGPGGEWPEGAALLAKPFAPDVLTARVRRMLAGRALPV